MSKQSRRSKEEHLARVRKNQQKCRERKRVRMTELEQQVQELKTQVQDHQPYPGALAHYRERQAEEALRENAALRRLLNAIGIDEHCQRRYLESVKKRDVVDLVLKQQDREVDTGPLSSENGTGNERSARTYAAAAMQQSAYSSRNPTETGFGSGEMDNINVDPLQLEFDATLGEPYTILNDVSLGFGGWLGDIGRYEDVRSGVVQSVNGTNHSEFEQPRDMPMQHLPMTTQLFSGSDEAMRYPSTSCCNMDAAPLSNSESTTVCSVALAMVFQHNKKHLTLVELNEKLRFGYRKALERSQECRVENSVLFRVLAEISI